MQTEVEHETSHNQSRPGSSMNRPGDSNRNGSKNEALEVNPEISAKEAAKLADELGAGVANYKEPGKADSSGFPDWQLEIDSNFVIDTIGFSKGDVFLFDGQNTRLSQSVVEIVATNLFDAELKISNARTHSIDVEWCDVSTYGELWVEWLRGNVIPLRESTEYIREDTGEQIKI